MRVNIPYLPLHKQSGYCFQKLKNLIRRKGLLLVFALLILWLLTVHYYNFIFSMLYCITFIQVDEIESYLQPATIKTVNAQTPLCSLFEKYEHPVMNKNYLLNETMYNTLHTRLNIKKGGSWEPQNCIPQHEVAIIIPYLNREEQLKIFLSHIHWFLQKQFLSYQIFIIEQRKPADFNRGKLLNIGYMEALKIRPFHCFIFHDVDLMPTNFNNIYACTKEPRHMSVAIDIFNYQLPYCSIFGGAIAMLQHQFKQVNGFSNIYFGWGAEDDDLFRRLLKYYSICRFSKQVSEYVMLSHEKQEQSKQRFEKLDDGPTRYTTDGLNTLKYNYTVVSSTALLLETRIVVDL